MLWLTSGNPLITVLVFRRARALGLGGKFVCHRSGHGAAYILLIRRNIGVEAPAVGSRTCLAKLAGVLLVSAREGGNLRPDAEAWLEYPKGVLGEKETPPQNATQALPSIVAWEGCDRRRYLIGDNRASKPSLRLWMSSAGREPTLPTGAPDMVVAAPAESSGDVRPRLLTPPTRAMELYPMRIGRPCAGSKAVDL